jgi:hypothetical protein
VLALCLLCLAAIAPGARADEVSVRKGLKSEAVQLLESGDIAGYVGRATQLRQRRERTPAGVWELSVFYKGVDLLPQNPGAPEWSRIERDTAAYLNLHPDSPSAVIAAARVLVARAWAYRATGDENAYLTWLGHAADVLQAHREVGAQDPDWFALHLQVMNGQGSDRTAVLAEAKRALAVEPTYESTYYVASNSFLPKWGGDTALMRQYLAALLAATSAEEGRQVYARIAFNFARIDPQPIRAIRDAGMQWPEVRQSLEQITAAYPDPWNRNAERAMSCLIGTQQDWKASTARAGQPLIAVEWFDTFGQWADCAARQQAAQPTSIEGFVREVIFASPSAYLLTAVCGGALLAVAILYWRRRNPPRAGTSTGVEADPPDPAADRDAPARSYRTTLLWRCGQYGMGGFLSLAGLAGIWGFGAMADGLRDTPVGLALVFLSALLSSSGIMIIADARVSRVVLRGSLLQICELWRTRYIRREDIATQRTVRMRNNPAQLLLTFKDATRRPVRIPLVLATDTDFLAWFSSIPDVDAVAAAALEAEVREAPELGATPEERLARFASARQVAQQAAYAGPALFFWSSVYPRPYLLIIGLLITLPWLGVVLLSTQPGVYRFSAAKEPGRPNLAGAFFAVGLVLALRAAFDVHILDWRGLVPWMVAAAAVLAVFLVRSSRPERPPLKTAMLMVLVSAVYGFGTATSADALLDHSATTTYRPLVLGKHVTSGRNRSYELLVQPWGPRSAQEDIRVSPAIFSHVAVGEPVCVSTHSGALGSSWFSVAACDDHSTY